MTNTNDERLAVHAYLSLEAHDSWRNFSDENGVSVSALLEALGLTLKAEMAVQDPLTIRQDWIRAGRRIDVARRRRGR